MKAAAVPARRAAMASFMVLMKDKTSTVRSRSKIASVPAVNGREIWKKIGHVAPTGRTQVIMIHFNLVLKFYRVAIYLV